MARKVRISYPGAVYHVMARGNERARVFHGRKDYELFLKALEEGLMQFEVKLHAWCLMPNHIHLALETPQGNLSRFMGWLQTTFTVRYNRSRKRSGHLFQGRYRAELVDQADYGRWLVLYIHLNPIRSRTQGVVHYTGKLEDLNHFEWSSHPDYAGLRSARISGLSLDWLEQWAKEKSKARQGYLKEIKRQIGSQEPLDWKSQVKLGLVVGNDQMLAKVKLLLKDKGRETGALQRKQIQGQNRKKRLAQEIKKESDPRNQVWIRVKLLGERKVDIAREKGLQGSGSIYHLVKRVEKRAQQNQTLQAKLNHWIKMANVVD
jgi:putative transposase